MTLQEFLAKAKQMRGEASKDTWHMSTCNVGEACWCRTISNREGSDSMDDCIVPSGSVNKDNAQFIAFSANHWNTLLQVIELQGEALKFYMTSGRDEFGQLYNKVPSAQDKNVLVYGQITIGSKARQTQSEIQKLLSELK